MPGRKTTTIQIDDLVSIVNDDGHPALEIHVPGMEPLRLVNAELEDYVDSVGIADFTDRFTLRQYAGSDELELCVTSSLCTNLEILRRFKVDYSRAYYSEEKGLIVFPLKNVSSWILVVPATGT